MAVESECESCEKKMCVWLEDEGKWKKEKGKRKSLRLRSIFFVDLRKFYACVYAWDSTDELCFWCREVGEHNGVRRVFSMQKRNQNSLNNKKINVIFQFSIFGYKCFFFFFQLWNDYSNFCERFKVSKENWNKKIRFVYSSDISHLHAISWGWFSLHSFDLLILSTPFNLPFPHVSFHLPPVSDEKQKCE